MNQKTIKATFLPHCLAMALTSCGQQALDNRPEGAKNFSAATRAASYPDNFWLAEGSLLRVRNELPTVLEIGTGMGDVTGPASGKMMMGFVNINQKTSGIDTRLWSRAFALKDQRSEKVVVMANAELCFITQAVKQQVVARLQEAYGQVFSNENVLIMANHTHSGPGGYSHYKFYNVSALGYSPQNFEIIVNGITASIKEAYESMKPGYVTVASGRLKDTGRNRSIEAYQNNPKAERDRYITNTNELMTNVSFNSMDGQPLGILNWFPVHATSSERDGTLISSDNKGFASMYLEKSLGRDHASKRGFIASFANSEAGDVSPNTLGDLDGDGDWDCQENTNKGCVTDSGMKHVTRAQELMAAEQVPIIGTIDTAHRYVDFSRVKVEPKFTRTTVKSTCYAAIGLSMLAGAPEDGPGVLKEGSTCDSIPSALANLLCKRQSDRQCHGSKPIAVSMGKWSPEPGTPEVLPIQIIRLGQLAIAAVPAEFTTMSGRRIRNAVFDELRHIGVEQVVLAGYSNAYAGYVATQEEYLSQQYEGASTHFGPWTQAAYEQSFSRLAEDMKNGLAHRNPGPSPRAPNPDLLDRSPEAEFDRAGVGRLFGMTVEEAKASYKKNESVSFRVVGSSLNHGQPDIKSFMTVERLSGSQWVPVAYDWDLNTEIHWVNLGLGRSDLVAAWKINDKTESGTYRIRISGRALVRIGGYEDYEGTSRTFKVE